MQASKQMIETGDYIHIRFQDEPRNKKPAGIHWLQAVAVHATGQDLSTAWAYRLPSAIAAWIAVLGCFAFCAQLTNRKTALLAGTILATSFMVIIEAHIAKTDAAVLGTTSIAMGALALIYAQRERANLGIALTFWLALAAGTLIKGPVSLAVAAATVLALALADRDVRWLRQTRPLIGVPVALAITLPWLLAASGPGGGNFVVEAIRGDLIPKLIGGQESHGAPPGTHLLAAYLTTWPWSLVFPFAVVIGWQQRTNPVVRFFLGWLCSTWILFEIIPTKLPHYTLPAFPALAVLIALALQSPGLRNIMRTPGGYVHQALWAAATIAFGGGVVYASLEFGGDAMTSAGLACGVMLLTAALSFLQRISLVTLSTAGAAAFSILLSAGIVPRLSQLAVSSRLAAATAPYRAAGQPLAMAGYSEPSAVFLLGTGTLLTSTASVTDFLMSRAGAIGVIESDQVPAVTLAVAPVGRLRELGSVQGYNYSRGEPVALSIVDLAPPGPQP